MKHTNDTAAFTRIFSFAGIDTAFVLLFLAMEYGRAVRVFTLDGTMMAITMAMVLVLPYFLPSAEKCSSFAGWMIGRTLVGFAGLVMGAIVGTLAVPAWAASIPITLLVLASMISCYVQFYGLLKLRLAK